MENKEPYTYKDAGFSTFYRRSINNPERAVTSLKDYSRTATQQVREINFEQNQMSGQLADVVNVGDGIRLDGSMGRISIFDSLGNEVGRIGELSDERG